MQRIKKVLVASSLSVIIGTGAMLTSNVMADASKESSDIEAMIAEGKKIAFNRKKGNCLACHEIKGGVLPGNIGPILISIKARFPDKSKLREQIWDASIAKPDTIMVPFGRHKVLTEDEIDKVVEFIYSL